MEPTLTHESMDELSDADLVAAALTQPEAFEHLVERYYPLIFTIARARLGNVETAEDLAQEVVLRLHLHLHRLRNNVAFPRWIRQVTRNLASNWAASGQVRSRLLPLISLEDVATTLYDARAQDARSAAQRKQERSMLELAIRRLPAALQEVVLLHYAEGLSKSDVARQLGMHPSSAGRYLDRALVLLREDLRPLLTQAARPLASTRRAAVPAGAVAIAIATMPAPARAAVHTALAEGAAAAAGGKAAGGSLVASAAIFTTGKIAGLAAVALAAVVAVTSLGGPAHPEPPRREFRGVWVPTVANMDWPSKPGLPAQQQREELDGVVQAAAGLGYNAVVFQVRPCADALYNSNIEPWSEFLTGRQGVSPGWDPLEHLVREAHGRCMDVHAWVNPFRASHPSEKSEKAANHLLRTRPELVTRYGQMLWLDPGDEEVQQHCLRVVEDILTRYEVDGIHFDDYFYPYPEQDAAGKPLPFPDDKSWGRYQASGGKLPRDDWRRDNVDRFVRRTQELIRKTRPHALFGISPLATWRPNYPQGAQSRDPYTRTFADSRKWWNEGWIDYLSPQIYTTTNHSTNGFVKVLGWWAGENKKNRHLWPGIHIDSHSAEEAVAQVEGSRKLGGVTGSLHFSAGNLALSGGTGPTLRKGPFAESALVPASPWIDSTPPAAPRATLLPGAGGAALNKVLKWQAGDSSAVKHWCLYQKRGSRWTLTSLWRGETSATLQLDGRDGVSAVAVSAVDMAGNESDRAEVQVSAGP